MAPVLIWLGYVLCFAGGLWIVVLAFRKGILWGVGCLFVPILQLIYVALYWKQAKAAFFLQVTGLSAFFVSAVIGK